MEQILEYLAEQISVMMSPSVEKIGIGVPSVVDVERGVVYNAANIPSWKEVHLKQFLEKRFGIPVSVNNDANCYSALNFYFWILDLGSLKSQSH